MYVSSVFFFLVSAGGEQDAESGARLTCHLLLRLFKPSYMSISPLSRHGRSNLFGIKSSVDMHLLEAAHDTITVGAVLAMLKAMLVLGILDEIQKLLKGQCRNRKAWSLKCESS